MRLKEKIVSSKRKLVKLEMTEKKRNKERKRENHHSYSYRDLKL